MKKTTMPDWCVAVKKAMIDHDDKRRVAQR